MANIRQIKKSRFHTASDGTGLVLIYKRLGEGGFSWPRISDGVPQLSRVQFEALFDGVNWKRVGERIVATPTAAN